MHPCVPIQYGRRDVFQIGAPSLNSGCRRLPCPAPGRARERRRPLQREGRDRSEALSGRRTEEAWYREPEDDPSHAVALSPHP